MNPHLNYGLGGDFCCVVILLMKYQLQNGIMIIYTT